MAAQLGDIIKRYYTGDLDKQTDKTVYDLFEWELRDVYLTDYKTGRVLVDMKGLEFPKGFSQNAVDIVASKYFRKAGVPQTGHETSFKQLVHRMVDFWVAALIDEGMVQEGEESQILYDELAYLLISQRFAPNSPQWFNTGLHRAYGIKGTSNETFYYDPELKKVVPSVDAYTRTQASACFIISVADTLLGPHSITEEYVTETKLFKGGSGTGSNFSTIRAEGEALSGGGVSSGLMSFLRGLDRNAGAIKSGGTTRRAAKMVCLDIDHPDIEQFVNWKAEEEDKALALMKMGYDASIDGEAYQTVSGQNSNNSLRISDDFMRKVVNLENDPDAMHQLKGRVDSKVDREISVKSLWDQINQAAWRCADPAPQFSDIFNAWHTCPAGEDGKLGAKHNMLNSTNPCGEYAFLDDTSCNLASINVYRFYDPATERFDLMGYKHAVALVQLALEASIVWGQFPTEDVARRTYLFRTTGLGMANLASLLMVKGLAYDSHEARTFAAALTGILTGMSYEVSALEAAQVGAFESYEINRDHMMRVIRNHARVAGARTDEYEGLGYAPFEVDHDLLKDLGEEELSNELKRVWAAAEEYGDKFGYRNAQVSVMAPTGTISFAMDCGATSIEPFFTHISYKKLVGGGSMVISNPVIGEALHHLGYAENEIEAIEEYISRKNDEGMLIDGKIEGAPYLKDEDLAIFDTTNVCGSGVRYIKPEGHVLMVAALTPLVSGAISKTVNLPKSATVEDFKNVLVLSWQTGVKGITLYRDGSKVAQPLNNSLEDVASADDLENMSYQALLDYAKQAKQIVDGRAPLPSKRRKIVGIRGGHTHPAQIDGIKIYTTVNRDEQGNIAEIYMTTDREGTTIMGLLNSLSKTISVMLQYGIPAQSISKMLRAQQYEPYGFVQRHPYIKYVTSISDLISKIIDIEVGDFSRCQVKPSAEDAFVSTYSALSAASSVASGAVSAAENFADTEETSAQFQELIAQKEDELRDDEGTAFEAEDPFTQSFIHEGAKEAALHGQRLYDGSTCPTCSSTRLVQNGTCKVCLDCGSTTGCS